MMLGWLEIEGATLPVTDGFPLNVGLSLGSDVGNIDLDGFVLGI